MKRPVLVFDGDCGFCRRWVWRWQSLTGDKVEYASYQSAGARFPQIAPERFSGAVHLIEPGGRASSGAEAVFRLLDSAAGRRWPMFLYRRVPGVARASEAFYAFVARHRPLFSCLTRFLWGDRLEPPSYYKVRWLFLRLLGLVYFFAFGSFYLQADGLLGQSGILPAAQFLSAVKARLGAAAYHFVPTLFWLGASDAALRGAALAGAALGAVLILDVAPGPVCLVSWALYLSIVNIGRDFMSFQWDILLLEAGFLAIFLAPWKLRPGLSREKKTSGVLVGLYRWLLFRLVFESGCVKLLSGDPNWRNLTALDYHYWTQPLPTWVGYYAAHLPEVFQKFSVASVFGVELVLPFLFFLPRRPRHWAFAGVVFLQTLIALTGNYCFFNLLTVSLCLFLLDDAYLERFWPRAWAAAPAAGKPSGLARRGLAALLAVLAVGFGAAQVAGNFLGRLPLPGPVGALYEELDPWHLVNSYGLFAVMTTSRHEILIQGSADGKTWLEYPFRWKPDALDRRPSFVEPYQPRLDWQMWFAALSDCRDNPWLLNFMARLLQGSSAVQSLMAGNPFPDAPPKYLRAVVYDYHFTTLAQKRATGDWWTRKFLGSYCPIVSLRR
ncbi:MAG TPA: lipase maturation factor family protein [Elusimicrobiota bacterium]|nr:lipase maturation factor family protein [Elusimicrobiota bacterium]